MTPKPLQLLFELNKDARPQLMLSKIKEIADKEMNPHPLFIRTLKMMKKTHVPYILLALEKEIIIDFANLVNYERGLRPTNTGFAMVNWTQEDISDFNTSPKEFVRAVVNLYISLGYSLINSKELGQEEGNKLFTELKNRKAKDKNKNNTDKWRVAKWEQI